MRKIVLEFAVEDIDQNAQPVEPLSSSYLLKQFTTEGHFATHHYFYDNKDQQRAVAYTTKIEILD